MKKLKFILVSVLGVMTLMLSSCGKEGCEDPKANNYNADAKKDCGCCLYPTINVNNTTGGKGGDFVGAGGSATKTFTFENTRPTAEYNMDITTGSGGSAQMVIKDASGVTVADYSLLKGQTEDSKSGVTASGQTGTWTVTITVTNFNGDGSYSISQGT